MQVNFPFVIELIFKDGYAHPITGYTLFSIIGWTRETISNHGKPIAFKLLKLNTSPNLPKLIKWIEEEFKPLFEYNPLKWLASVGTCCPELHPYLLPYNKES